LYRIEYSPEAENHLRALTARERSIVLDAVEEQLTHEPNAEARNRKPMRPNPVAPWELRIDRLRVYYDVQESPQRVVKVAAVGIKHRGQVRIGGEVIEL
jgi:mRNA-degrading endonuclease RelE of RelBE toxin-antitoxin system